MKVTTGMLVDADAVALNGGLPSAFKRISMPSGYQREQYEKALGRPMPSHFVSEDIAVTIKCYPPRGDFEWVTWRTIVRPGADEEIAALCAGRPGFAALIASSDAESEEDRQRKAMAQQLEAAHLESERRNATAVCGAPLGNAAAPCTDADEARCEWFVNRPADGASLRLRTLARPPACPRRQAHELKVAELAALRSRSAAERLIPASLVECITLKAPAPSPALEAVRTWFRSGRKLLALCGPSGCGKSLAAAAWLLSIESGSPLWVSGSVLTIETLPHSEREVLRRASSSSALVIDGVSPQERGPVIDLLLGAVRSGCSVILTTTMTREQWTSFLSPDDDEPSPMGKRWALYGSTVQLGPWSRSSLVSK